MVTYQQERGDISKEMELYRMAGGTFGFTMAIKDRRTKMRGKLQFVSNFIIHCLFIICLKFRISMFFLMFLLFLLTCSYLVDKLWW